MPGPCILQSFHELVLYYVIPVPACAKTETYALELRALVRKPICGRFYMSNQVVKGLKSPCLWVFGYCLRMSVSSPSCLQTVRTVQMKATLQERSSLSRKARLQMCRMLL